MKKCCEDTIKTLQYATNTGVSCECGQHWTKEEFKREVLNLRRKIPCSRCGRMCYGHFCRACDKKTSLKGKVSIAINRRKKKGILK